jgi:hypothetical protein
VKVPYSEGVANHTDPESCAGHREMSGEALTGESAGQAIEPRKSSIGMPTPSSERKATWADTLSRGPARSRVVEDPGMCRRSLRGNREVSCVAAAPLVHRPASGRRGAVADDARA